MRATFNGFVVFWWTFEFPALFGTDEKGRKVWFNLTEGPTYVYNQEDLVL